MVSILLSGTSVGGDPAILFLPNSLHVDFNSDVIPEPSTAVMLALGGMMIVRARRRRRITAQRTMGNVFTGAITVILCVVFIASSTEASATIISTVPVDNPGNANDTTGFGA